MGELPVEYPRQTLFVDQQVAGAEVPVQEHTGCFGWRVINQPVQAELHRRRDIAKCVQPLLRRGKALIQRGRANIDWQLGAVDAVNAPERLATLERQPISCDFISIVNQPFLRDALPRDKAHEKSLANGVCGVKDRVDVGDGH